MDIITEVKRYFRPLTIHPWRAAWRVRHRGLLAAFSAWFTDLAEVGHWGRRA